MQALARNNEEGDGSAYAFFPSQFLQSPFLRCSHLNWTKTLDELITSFYKYMLFLVRTMVLYFWCDNIENDKFESNKFTLQ